MPKLDDLVGQIALKNLLRPKIQFARERGVALPHLLLCGEREQGKMTFATAIAEELNVPFASVSANSLNTFPDLAGPFTNLHPREILVISDVDAIRPTLLDVLVSALSSFRMQITIGVGSGARRHELPLPRFTFVGTTSKPWLIDERVRRWCISCQLASYTLNEATQIVLRIAESKRVPLDVAAAVNIVAQCGVRPGDAEVFLQRVVSHSPFGVTERIDRERLRLLTEFLGAGDLSPDSLSLADKLRTMGGIEFEHWVADLFRRAGFQVEITQASGDHGVDLWATLGNHLVAVQCKRWDGTVGEPVMRDLYGAMVAAQAQSACLVTTGSFTAQAHDFSRDKPLHLMGFDHLMEATRSPERLRQIVGGR